MIYDEGTECMYLLGNSFTGLHNTREEALAELCINLEEFSLVAYGLTVDTRHTYEGGI
jgi:hypothetical protein